ncbi:peptide ligase PGM1-related protein [Micromonospora inyonensis]|uniref:ATP-grasp domain-containing protein n=1 Tax=Micromonospora inyonensis TaxID=47866 RepID=A0A1C6SMT3_9ACTN|nr:peptide ligase PGM1-related protein [Micromonospora inyonensis]SCL30780.1 hypothetical protein GA0074694_5796 [Micromonospora inyonensis]
MPRLLLGDLYPHDFGGDVAPISDTMARSAAAGSQAIVWYAESGDVIVLPQAPDPEFLAYRTTLLGVDRESLRIVVPPIAEASPYFLTRDRLTSAAGLAELRDALAGRTVDRIVALMPDAAIAALATELGCPEALPGHQFFSQGGALLANGKACFRAVAAGVGAPLPPGGVARGRADARALVMELLEQGHPVILKRDFGGGGMGSEVVALEAIPHPVGAQRAVHLPSTDHLDDYLDERWDWLTNGDRFPVVVERYYHRARAIFAEFEITDEAATFEEHGEIIHAPIAFAEFIPAPDLPPDALDRLVTIGQALAEGMRMMGYRGVVSADAILLDDGEVLLTEWNGRMTASTTIYRNLGRRLIGPDFSRCRALGEFVGWRVPSFPAAVARLDEAGLHYDPATRTGVVIVKGFNPEDSTVRYCVIAENTEAATQMSSRVEGLFGPKDQVR